MSQGLSGRGPRELEDCQQDEATLAFGAAWRCQRQEGLLGAVSGEGGGSGYRVKEKEMPVGAGTPLGHQACLVQLPRPDRYLRKVRERKRSLRRGRAVAGDGGMGGWGGKGAPLRLGALSEKVGDSRWLHQRTVM